MDINKIKKLIAMLQDTDISEIEIQEAEGTIKLTRYAHGNPVATTPHHVQIIPTMAQPAVAPIQPAIVKEEKNNEIPRSGHMTRSPMVGTFYSAPAPDAPPFVQIGKSVKQGDTIGIIEAMKMFNEVEADKSGVIKEILITNGSPVEFDQPLFIIE